MACEHDRTAGERFRLKKSMRVRSPQEFERIYAARTRAGDEHLLVFALAGATAQTRFGLSVSRKHGNAVRRARLKRLLREAFRLSQHELPAGLDLVLIPRQESETSIDQYRQSLVRLTHKLHRRLGGGERA